MLLDIDNKEMARVMLEELSELYVKHKQTAINLESYYDLEEIRDAYEAQLNYQAVRDVAAKMRFVPAVKALERKANEFAKSDIDGWAVFLKSSKPWNEVLKAALDVMEIEYDDIS